MAIGTYAELKTAIANWLARSNLSDRIPEFVTLAVADIHYGIKAPDGGWVVEPLRIRQMETSADITINARTAAFPTGYLESRRLYIDGSPVEEVFWRSPQDLWALDSTTNGKPCYYTEEAENFVFSPLPDATYTGKLLYLKKFTDFSADGDTNWLLTNHPGIYLEASLHRALAYARNMEGAKSALNRFATGVAGLNGSAGNQTSRGARLRIQLNNVA